MTNNQSKPREWTITSLDENHDGPDVQIIGPDAHLVSVIEKSAYDQLLAAQAIENEMLKIATDALRYFCDDDTWYGGPDLSDYAKEAIAKIESLKRGKEV